ncbi:MAG: type II/IV secretion system ATPase subunit, partial [Candidatus Hadarchaeales archaeon]
PLLNEAGQEIFKNLINYLKFKFSLEEAIQDREKALSYHISEFLRSEGKKVSVRDAYALFYHARRECFGFKEIDALMKDPGIEDISCNGLNVPVFLYHRKYYNIPTNIVFTDEDRLNNLVISLVERCGKMISFGRPTVDATLPDGSRLQATLGTEITTRGSTFTIRKFAKEPFTPVHLLRNRTYSSEMLAYLWLAVENKKNVIIVGETASGKTSTLNALSLFIPPDAKIISLEETRELTLYQQNWIPSVTRATIGEGGGGITLYDLLLQAMRQRPECLIVGEVRGKEGLTLFQAMSTGHTCYSTLHSSSIEEAINRLEGAPLNIPHNMIAALDIACFQSITYLGQQRVRRAQSIVEIAGIDPATNSLRVQEVFRWVPSKDTFEQVAASVVLREIAEKRGWSQERLRRELENRKRLLELLLENNVVDHDRVSEFMRIYHISPEEAMKKLTKKS